MSFAMNGNAIDLKEIQWFYGSAVAVIFWWCLFEVKMVGDVGKISKLQLGGGCWSGTLVQGCVKKSKH